MKPSVYTDPVGTEASLSRLGLSLQAAQLERLERFESLLRRHAPLLGLVSEDDLPRIFERHILDSLRAASEIAGGDICDLGSGAGLPGIPLAVALPHCSVVLCEAKRRRVAFLELAVEQLGLANAAVAPVRAEDLPERSADACTTRAFAPLEESWAAAWPVLRPGGRLVYFAGARLRDLAARAAALDRPEPPVSVDVVRVLANEAPLVIMARR